MKGVTEEFLLFTVGVFVILVIATTMIGRGIVYNMLGTLAQMEPSYIQENIRTVLIVASYTPGTYEAIIKIPIKHTISLNDTFYPSVYIDSKSQFKLSNTSPIAFLTECEIVKKCTKTCNFIGEPCGDLADCCGRLNCEFGTCNSSYCGNGVLDSGEECENFTNLDFYCPGQCQKFCTCPLLHGKDIRQCSDGVDNDGDGLIDIKDTGCHSDGLLNPTSYVESDDTEGLPQCNDNSDNDKDGLFDKFDPVCHTDDDASNLASYDANKNREYKIEGEYCKSDIECWLGNTRLNPLREVDEGFACMTRVSLDKMGDSLLIRKYFEDNVCKIRIEKV